MSTSPPPPAHATLPPQPNTPTLPRSKLRPSPSAGRRSYSPEEAEADIVSTKRLTNTPGSVAGGGPGSTVVVDGRTYVSVVPGRAIAPSPQTHDDGATDEARPDDARAGFKPGARAGFKPGAAPSTLDRVQQGAVMRQTRHELAVRRGDRGLGVDVDERNAIVRILPRSTAEADGLLHVGDVIVSVNGKPVGRKLLKQVRSSRRNSIVP